MKVRDIIKLIEEDGWYWIKKKVVTDSINIQSKKGVLYQLNNSAYVPDLPGCVSTGSTVSEVEKNIKEAISFHIDGLKEDGLPVPEPSTICEYIETT